MAWSVRTASGIFCIMLSLDLGQSATGRCNVASGLEYNLFIFIWVFKTGEVFREWHSILKRKIGPGSLEVMPESNSSHSS